MVPQCFWPKTDLLFIPPAPPSTAFQIVDTQDAFGSKRRVPPLHARHGRCRLYMNPSWSWLRKKTDLLTGLIKGEPSQRRKLASKHSLQIFSFACFICPLYQHLYKLLCSPRFWDFVARTRLKKENKKVCDIFTYSFATQASLVSDVTNTAGHMSGGSTRGRL